MNVLTLHEFCRVCGWRKGGLDSWNGHACKCGHASAPMTRCDACAGAGSWGYQVTDMQVTVCQKCNGSGLVPKA